MSQTELNRIQSNLSFSYLHAVVSKAGGICTRADWEEDKLGEDAHLTFPPCNGRPKVKIDVQLKSTREPLTIKNGRISFSLLKEQYERYRQASMSPYTFLLVLFHLPDNPEEWISLSENELILRKCAYWTGLRCAPECQGSSITIYIPAKNILSAENLEQIVQTILNEEGLYYES